MAKNTKLNRKQISVDDVLRGRGPSPSARDLIALIRQVNPSDLGLPAPEMVRRYAQKSRLQSLLIRQFPDEIEVDLDASNPGVVSLRHRPLGADACHAVIHELDDDARSWVQHQIDLRTAPNSSDDDRTANRTGRGSGSKRAPGSKSAVEPIAAEGNVSEMLRAGQDALEEYDYERARNCFEFAFEQASGGVQAALPLLTLLVDHLAANDEALLIEARLGQGVVKDVKVRQLLALAAARCSQRDKALSLLQGDGGSGGADVFVALARAAIDAGQLDEAANDLTEVRQRDPMHPELAGLLDAVAERRASERLPYEKEVTRLVAERQLDEAESRARALLLRWPDSAEAQRALRAIDEVRKTDQCKDLLASAAEAMERGSVENAISLLQRAIALSPRAEQTAQIQQRIAEVESVERRRVKRAQEERVVRLLGDSDLMPGLVEYVALTEEQRDHVKIEVALPHLDWVDQMGASGSGRRARAAALAALALDRASAIVADDPYGALELLNTHGKLVQGIGLSAEVTAEAQRRIDARRREEALVRLDAARAALDDADVNQAQKQLASIPLGDLSDDGQVLAEQLRLRIHHAVEGKTAEQLRSRGALLRARRLVETLIERAEEQERPRWTALREQLITEIREAFHVQLDATSLPLASLSGMQLQYWNGAMRAMIPNSNTIILADTRGPWLFLRLCDLVEQVIRLRVTLRMPKPMSLLTMEIVGERMIIIGEFASVLEMSISDWTVLGWHERIGMETDSAPPDCTSLPAIDDLPSGYRFEMYTEIVEDVALVPGTTLLWLTGSCQMRSFVRIVDLARGCVVRAWSEAPGNLRLRVLDRVDGPTMMVIRVREGSISLYEPLGIAIEGTKHACTAWSMGIVTVPRHSSALILTGNTGKENKREETSTSPKLAGWCSVSPEGRISQEQLLLEDELVASDVIAAVDAGSSMMFVKVMKPNGDAELLGFKVHAEGALGLESVFRVAMSGVSAMVQGGDGQGVWVLADSGDRVDAIRLGPEPPKFRSCLPAGQLKFLDMYGRAVECYYPTGARLAAVQALCGVMKNESDSALLRRIDQAKRFNDPDELLNLGYALGWCGKPHQGGVLGTYAMKRHPDNVEMRIGHARALMGVEEYKLVIDLLLTADPSGLDDGNASHLHHLLGIALMIGGETEAALRVFEKAALYPEGHCDLEPVMALCTPLPKSLDDPDDAREWDANQTLVRSLMRAIQAADEAMARDPADARRIIARWCFIEPYEVQSLARVAQAYLWDSQAVEEHDRFDKAFALASFFAVHAQNKVMIRRELPLLNNRWPKAKLDAFAHKAEQWLDKTLGQPWPWPPGRI